MNKKILIIFSLVMLGLSCKSQTDDKVKIFVAWPGAEYLPSYKWKTNEEKPTGIEPALIEKILTMAGYEYTYVKDYNPANDVDDVRISVVTDDIADISIRSITINEPRKEKVNFSIPYYYDGLSAMVTDNNIENKADFSNKVVYAEKFTTAYQWATENLPNAHIVTHENFNNEHPQDLLLKGKVDVLLADRTWLMTMARKNTKLKVLDKKFTKEPFGIAVDKNQKELLVEINSAIKKLKETGELDELTAGFEK